LPASVGSPSRNLSASPAGIRCIHYLVPSVPRMCNRAGLYLQRATAQLKNLLSNFAPRLAEKGNGGY
jgi:hypothetical protein